MEVGEERYEVGPESFVWLPRNVPHAFANLGTEEVWTVGLLNPHGLSGMFREQADYFASLQGPPDPAVLLEIGLRYGVHPVDGAPIAQASAMEARGIAPTSRAAEGCRNPVLRREPRIALAPGAQVRTRCARWVWGQIVAARP